MYLKPVTSSNILILHPLWHWDTLVLEQYRPQLASLISCMIHTLRRKCRQELCINKIKCFYFSGGSSYLWSSNYTRLHSGNYESPFCIKPFRITFMFSPMCMETKWSIIGALIDYISEEYEESACKYAEISYINNDVLHGLAKRGHVQGGKI
jgi:hypothetical protein